MQSPQKTSQNGLSLIEQAEGYRATVYKCSAGYPTIGIGHKILPGEAFTFLTHEQAIELLQKDIIPGENAINKYVKVSINQNMFDALSSFIFNVGVSAFISSTLLKKLNVADYEGAADELLKWNKIKI